MSLNERYNFTEIERKWQKRWRDAKFAFEDILRAVPEHEQGDPVDEVLVGNIEQHLNFVSSKIKR